MELTNFLVDFKPSGDAGRGAVSFSVKRLILMLAPFAPHLAEEFWGLCGEKPSIFDAAWPEADANLAREDSLEIPIQVNGRLRGTIVIDRGTPESELRKMILKDERVAKFIGGKPVKKWVVVPEKLVNLVL